MLPCPRCVRFLGDLGHSRDDRAQRVPDVADFWEIWDTLQSKCASTESNCRSSNSCTNVRLAANNNIHLPLASSNNVRSHIVLRHPARQVCNWSIVGEFFCAGDLSGQKIKLQKCKKFSEAGEERRAVSPRTFTSVSKATRSGC